MVLLRARYLPSACMCRGPRGDPGANTDDTQPWVGIHLARPQRSKVAQTGWRRQQGKLSAVGMSVLGCKGGEAITGQNWWGAHCFFRPQLHNIWESAAVRIAR